MNYLCSFLDKFALISNSDAHSPDRIGRNANFFETDLSYEEITNALKNVTDGFKGTIDLFPQEGKYHFDGHRNCGVVYDPLETLKHNYICPICNKRLTIGVMHRVAWLSDRNSPDEKSGNRPGSYIIPLKEILSEIIGVGENSIAVVNKYNSLIGQYGNEFNILLFKDLDEIKKSGDFIFYEAIKRLRNNRVFIREGYDGEYGRIKLFANDEGLNPLGNDLFGEKMKNQRKSFAQRKIINFDLDEYKRLKRVKS
jgi:PHP family Zn ribbon phosphoesterase